MLRSGEASVISCDWMHTRTRTRTRTRTLRAVEERVKGVLRADRRTHTMIHYR